MTKAENRAAARDGPIGGMGYRHLKTAPAWLLRCEGRGRWSYLGGNGVATVITSIGKTGNQFCPLVPKAV